MRFGLFLQPVHPPSEHPTVALERDLELVTLLDRLGYDEVWVGEHHSTGWENIGAPDVFIAAAAERTRSIRLGTGVIQLGLHHPLVVADRMIFLDHLTRGRSMFGVGVGGGLPSDLEVVGLSREEAGRRLEEGMDAIVRLLTSDEPIDEKTDWFELHNATLQIAPYTKPHPPFAMATTNRRNVQTLGRLGGHVLTGPVPQRVTELLENLKKGAAEAGGVASRDQITLSYAMHLAETREQAIADIREGAIHEQLEFNVAVNGAPRPANIDEWFDRFVDTHIVGTPDDAIEKIEGLLKSSGGFGGILFTSRDWAGKEASWASWEMFARQVAPAFQDHVGQQSRAAEAAGRLNGPTD
ncbi:MAG: LLM class flavin-dependent oxidoreductase [Acidimicrobiia bacterium]|jgi:limonene 1,2-monooxygenase